MFHHEPLLIRMDPSVLVPSCGAASIRTRADAGRKSSTGQGQCPSQWAMDLQRSRYGHGRSQTRQQTPVGDLSMYPMNGLCRI